MARTLPQATDSTALGDIGPLRESFLRHLAAENKPEQFLAVARKIERSTGTGQPRLGFEWPRSTRLDPIPCGRGCNAETGARWCRTNTVLNKSCTVAKLSCGMASDNSASAG